MITDYDMGRHFRQDMESRGWSDSWRRSCLADMPDKLPTNRTDFASFDFLAPYSGYRSPDLIHYINPAKEDVDRYLQKTTSWVYMGNTPQARENIQTRILAARVTRWMVLLLSAERLIGTPFLTYKKEWNHMRAHLWGKIHDQLGWTEMENPWLSPGIYNKKYGMRTLEHLWNKRRFTTTSLITEYARGLENESDYWTKKYGRRRALTHYISDNVPNSLTTPVTFEEIKHALKSSNLDLYLYDDERRRKEEKQEREAKERQDRVDRPPDTDDEPEWESPVISDDEVAAPSSPRFYVDLESDDMGSDEPGSDPIDPGSDPIEPGSAMDDVPEMLGGEFVIHDAAVSHASSSPVGFGGYIDSDATDSVQGSSSYDPDDDAYHDPIDPDLPSALRSPVVHADEDEDLRRRLVSLRSPVILDDAVQRQMGSVRRRVAARRSPVILADDEVQRQLASVRRRVASRRSPVLDDDVQRRLAAVRASLAARRSPVVSDDEDNISLMWDSSG